MAEEEANTNLGDHERNHAFIGYKEKASSTLDVAIEALGEWRWQLGDSHEQETRARNHHPRLSHAGFKLFVISTSFGEVRVLHRGSRPPESA